MKVMTAALMLCFLSAPSASGQENKSKTESAINSVGMTITVVSVARACGMPAGKVDQAAELIAARVQEDVPELAKKGFHKEYFVEEINADLSRTREIIKMRKGFFFDKPCSHYISMVDGLISSAGRVLTFK